MRGSGGRCEADSGGSSLAPHAMVFRDSVSLGQNAMGAPTSVGPVLSGEQDLVPDCVAWP